MPTSYPLASGERLLAQARPRDWSRPPTFLLVYPHSYGVGMSNLGFQFLLAQMLSERRETFDRFFPLADGHDRLFPSRSSRAAPHSLGLGRPLAEFPVQLVSLSFETDQLHLLRSLRDAGLPLRAAARGEREPLIIAGGSAVSSNPAVARVWADAVVIGDGEPVLSSLCDLLADFAAGRLDRRETLSALQGLPGVLTSNTGGWSRLRERSVAASLDARPARTVLVSSRAVFRDSVLVEVTRGCGRGCLFCLTCYGQRPVRFLSREAFAALLETDWPPGTTSLGLVGASLADHPDLARICRDLVRRRLPFTTSSLRLDRISADALEAIAAGSSRTLTFAPEAGSEALRRLIGKPLSDGTLAAQLAGLAANFDRDVKLYFMVGLPGETEEDIEALRSWFARARDIFRRAGRGSALKIGLSPFVPKPGTPFQWAPFAGVRELERKLQILRKAAGKLSIRLTAESARASEVEALLSHGDHTVAEAVIRYVEQEDVAGGAAVFRRALGLAAGPLADLRREKAATAVFPWDDLPPVVPREQLRRRYERARADLD